MISVLVVEDSPVTRDYLCDLLTSDPALRIATAVESGEAALAYLAAHSPDVILMDIHLPGVDGYETTRRIMASKALPIVVCTASSGDGGMSNVMRAIDAGALAAVRKPRGGADREVDEAAIISTLKLMSEVKVVKRWRPVAGALDVARVVRSAPPLAAADPRGIAVVAMGASTGGPPVVAQILSQLSPDFPAPVLLVQHITAGFTRGFADWLGESTGWQVRLARAGDVPLPGHVYVAPDDRHLTVGSRGELQASDAPPSDGLRPSVGVLFRSVLECHGARAVGILLTGMGRDGAAELKRMSDRGALTVAQSEESCVVFGMPGEAVRLGAARHVLAPANIAALLNGLRGPRGMAL